ncbi:MAG: 2-phospho-L-lactate guanylyltransferase [Actinomycetota bacterium]
MRTAPAAVALLLRGFAHGKSRLAGALPPGGREALVREMAAAVRRAAGGLPFLVVTPDPVVRRWALEAGGQVVEDPGRGLDEAARRAREAVRQAGIGRLVLAHADLPLADDLTWLVDSPAVTVVTDRRGHGTNVLALPTPAPLRFGYGPRSCAHHLAEAHRLGLDAAVVADPLLGWDVDEPGDLPLPSGAGLDALQAASARERATPGAGPRAR